MVTRRPVSLACSAAAATLAVLVGGCMPNQIRIKDFAFSPPTDLKAAPVEQPYVLQRGDKLEVVFYYNPDLNTTAKIRPDGKISLPLIDEVTAAGLTPAQLDAELTRLYAKRLETADVTVILQDYTAPSIYVDGEVHNPAAIPFREHMNPIQAIAAAGSVNEGADLRTVLVIRATDPANVAVTSLDLTDLNQIVRDNLYLQPNDIVYVPATAIAQANLWVKQYLSKMMPDWLRATFAVTYNQSSLSAGARDIIINP